MNVVEKRKQKCLVKLDSSSAIFVRSGLISQYKWSAKTDVKRRKVLGIVGLFEHDFGQFVQIIVVLKAKFAVIAPGVLAISTLTTFLR